MEVVCGSYESMVFGCKLRKIRQEYDLELSFCDNSHGGNVKAVAVSENGILATGSSDETIELKSLKARKDLGSISHHEGSITALTFYGKTHLFSASEDGTIVIWKVGSWESLRVLKGHKSAVNDVAVHPSGKMAVSVSKDKTMRTWNLVTGRAAFTTNIKIAADRVIWMPNGERYIVLHDRTMDIHGVESGKLEHTITHETRINAISFIEDGILLAAGEGGVVFFYNTEDYSKVYEFPTETVRVKGMHCCASEESGAVWLVTGSADGKLQLWTLTSQQGKWSHRLDVSKDFGYRITSMAVRVDRTQLEVEKNVNNNKASTSDSKESKKRKKKQKNEGKRANEDGEEKPSKKKRKVHIEEEQGTDAQDEDWTKLDHEDDDDDDDEFLTRKVPSQNNSASRLPEKSDSAEEANDCPMSVSRKQSKRSMGAVSSKASKKSLVSLKVSKESLVSPKVSKESLASVSRKASKGSLASVSRKASKESVPVSTKVSKKSVVPVSAKSSQESVSSMAEENAAEESAQAALPAGDSPSTSKRAKKTQLPKNQSPKKKLSNKDAKRSKLQVKSKQNKKSLKNGANKLQKSESQPLHHDKTKQRKKVNK